MRKIRLCVLITLLIVMINNINIVKATDELPSNGAIITSSQITQMKTGTGPWDEDDTPGNDSSEDNNVVRSFDQVTWTVENTMAINGTGATSYNGGKIYFEATFPDSLDSSAAEWNLDSMAWIEDATISTDGRTLTGYYQMNTDTTTIPGKQTLVFVLSILGASNGTEFAPEFKMWMEGNEEDKYVTANSESITVSAAPKFNLKLVRQTTLSNKVNVDLDDDGTEETTGRMYGYSIVAQIYNEDESKGLKGLEYPTGDITFDIDLKFERTVDTTSTAVEDITDECTPILWNYKVNEKSDYGNISNRIMKWRNSNNYEGSGVPYGMATSDRNSSVYNSGDYSMTQSGSKIQVTLSDYAFDDIFPKYNGYYISTTKRVYGDNVGCFSVGYFQVLVPDNEASLMEDRGYYLTVKDSNLEATSLSGQTATTQMVTTDDSTKVQHDIYKKGKYSTHIDLLGNSKITDRGRNGDTYLLLGDTFNVIAYMNLNAENDEENDIYTANQLVKFDGDAFEPVSDSASKNFSSGMQGNGDMKFKGWYVAKKDGTNWTDETEMNNVSIEDLEIYENLSDMPEGYKCVGMYFESISGHMEPTYNSNVIKLKVKEDATTGQTYAITQDVYMWTETLDRSIYTVTNTDEVEYPTATYTKEHSNYIKTEYDEEGYMISGTNKGGYNIGQSVLVVGAKQNITVTPTDSAGDTKVNYNLANNEYVVTYKLTPSLTQGNLTTEITNVTVTVTDTLPAGLTYVPGSSSTESEPEITENEDGTTTLVWKIYGCKVGETIDDITFDAKIDEETKDGTQFTNTAVISADPDKIGNPIVSTRTATTTIQIINLASHRLYKTVENQCIESGDQIKYTLTYKNNTDGIIPDFQLLDILPYNGDGRGTDYSGTYKLEKIEVLRYDKDDNLIEDDKVSMYYTLSEDIRDGYSAKDEILTIGEWTEVESGNLIRENATAIALKGTATSQEKIVVNIYLTPEDNEAEDIYCNTATAQTNLNTEEITSTIVKVQVIKRIIEGNVFLDNDYDNVISDGDEYLKDIVVTLVDENNEQVTDTYGNIVDSVKTDENGYYSFENLSKGNYKVLFTNTDNTLGAVEKEVGTNDIINSKVNEDLTTDTITALNADTSAKLVASYINAGLVKKPTQVITKYVDIDTNEEIYDENTQDGRVDDAYTTVNELDNINEKYDDLYVYDSIDGNATGTMTVDTITVTYYYRKNKGNITVTKTDKSDETKKIEGATFKVEKLYDNGNVDDTFTAQELTTDDTGIVKFEDLSLGKYRITETKAPTGYELLENTIDVELTSANNEINVTAKNRLKLELPETGGANYIVIIAVVGMALMLSSYIVQKNNKMKNKNVI